MRYLKCNVPLYVFVPAPLLGGVTVILAFPVINTPSLNQEATFSIPVSMSAVESKPNKHENSNSVPENEFSSRIMKGPLTGSGTKEIVMKENKKQDKKGTKDTSVQMLRHESRIYIHVHTFK